MVNLNNYLKSPLLNNYNKENKINLTEQYKSPSIINNNRNINLNPNPNINEIPNNLNQIKNPPQSLSPNIGFTEPSEESSNIVCL